MADPRHDGIRPGPPSPDIQSALKEQYTDDVRCRALRFAKKRAWMVRRAGLPIPQDYEEELVDDAIGNLFVGIRSWDPARADLLPHLCHIIWDRTWREIRRAQRHQHVPYDLAVNDAELADDAAPIDDGVPFDPTRQTDVVGGVEQSLASASRGDISPLLVASFSRQVVDALHDLGEGNDAVRGIIGAWKQGFIEKDEVLLVTGLSVRAYDAAIKRIRRLAERLPPGLREAVHDLLRRAS